jgi:hypothetical protein
MEIRRAPRCWPVPNELTTKPVMSAPESNSAGECYRTGYAQARRHRDGNGASTQVTESNVKTHRCTQTLGVSAILAALRAGE